jgi:hypothetical protein
VAAARYLDGGVCHGPEPDQLPGTCVNYGPTILKGSTWTVPHPRWDGGANDAAR